MVGYLTIMSGFAVIVTFIILTLVFRKKDFKEIIRYYIVGLLAAFIDIIIEYLGTSTGHWVYNESIYFIFGLIPIELIFLFFSAGVILRFIFLNINKIKIPIKANAIFYILILIAFLMYVREIYQESVTNMLPLAIIIGLWGVSNISDKNKESSLILAISAVVLDLTAEIIIIRSGSYDYASGFSISIPIIYGLFTLGMLATMERLHKLDKFLDHPLVIKLLKLFGVYREKYSIKFEKAKEKYINKFEKAKEKIKEKF